MKFQKVFSIISTLVMLSSMFGVLPVSAAPQQDGGSQVVRQISSSTVTSFSTAGNDGQDVNGVQTPEIADEIRAAEAAGAQPNNAAQSNQPLVGRSETRDHHDHHDSDPLKSPRVKSNKIAVSNPGLFTSFDGLNHRNQRLANGGNQFSLEPPDQGMCAGNGFVLESVNDVLRVYDTSGNPQTGVIDLNTFYGYPAAINRSTGARGPFITDPSCIYDSDTQRWFNVVLTLDVDSTTGDFLGSNHLDIAVSTTADPTGSWVVYKLPVQDDGTDGTPNHGCSFGPCIGDYPHIGADKNGFYATTNEYSLFGPEFKSAQVYAFSKSALAANASTITVVQFDTTGAVNSEKGAQPGFTVWPANSPAGSFNTKAGGTEFFLSSNAGEEANGVPGGSFSNELIVWALTNSSSLNSATPNLALKNDTLDAEVYGIPPKADQKAGDFPLGQCINDTTTATPFGTGCWNLFFTAEPAHTEVVSPLDANDTRMQQVWYVGGKLWGSLDTIVKVGGQERAGVAFFVVKPDVKKNGKVDGDMTKQGYVAVAGNNVIYPAIAVLPSGKGIMAFTLVGQDYYPSAGYASIDSRGVGDIHVAASGLGPQDGFSGYNAFAGSGVARPRWGDYGSAVTDGNNIWLASEYIAQTCTLTQYLTGAIGSCGGTRTSLANWATRISGVTP
jgi:hypothetical protein